MSERVVWLEQSACQNSELAGSKAANLSCLAASYRVPSGFCLTTIAFDEHVSEDNSSQENGLPTAISTLLCDAYQSLAERTNVEQPAVAVRSSAIGEDGEDSSFAGQYETYLNIVGEAALCQAVADCWASAYSTRVEAYRQQQSQEAEAVQLAVLVQQLVAADMSLVAFSSHPVSGNTAEIVINATWGLGESLVGGTVTPDSYTVQKLDLDHIQRSISAKTVMTISAVGGVREVPVPRPMQQLPALTESQIQEVAELALALESEMGWPVDIECAFQNEKLYLLQCRPITA